MPRKAVMKAMARKAVMKKLLKKPAAKKSAVEALACNNNSATGIPTLVDYDRLACECLCQQYASGTERVCEQARRGQLRVHGRAYTAQK